MKKIILIDGNNLMFRSYYATAYTGVIMRNSKGLATNALYGFANMLNKIINEENPEYIAVAFDIGKSFRHEQYKEYKAGRSETPDDLITQMPYARKLLTAMGITYFEVPNYEADDIIGTLAKRANLDPEWDATLITSDHDYLQLITDIVDVKLLKPKGFTKYKPDNFKEEFGIDPIRVIDLKALMGDSSDNIPGVKGIGEKTALKLLQEYETLENLYDHIDEIKGKLQEKLISDKDMAFFSKQLATIYCDVPLEAEFKDMHYKGPNEDELNDLYRELEFYSLMSDYSRPKVENNVSYEMLTDVKDIDLEHQIGYYIECDQENYHLASILGMGLFDGVKAFYVAPERIKEVMDYTREVPKYTFDLKKNIILLKDFNTNTVFDLNLAAYLLNKTTKDDLAVLMNNDGQAIDFYHDLIKKKKDVKEECAYKAKYIFDVHDKYITDLKSEEMYDLYSNIEMPLVTVLAKMEYNGIRCDANILNDMRIELKEKIDKTSKEIYDLCGEEFNIASPRQLGDMLFEKLGLPHGVKGPKAYKTNAEVLEKLVGVHPVIELILEYRNMTKVYSTYLEGLNKYILDDGKIHTIYKQTLTRTGRLSSIDPNLQNIPARDNLGRLVRKAFLPEYDEFLSADYSQIELRVLAHISQSQELIDAFIRGDDIHTKVAADIFNKDMESVTKQERRTAKAVIFGIVYGISGFGLGENIGITAKEARKFIDKYLELYPGVKKYMDLIVKDAYECGYVRTLFHRKRVIEELFNRNHLIRATGERIALNTPIQGTSADIIKKAMVELDRAFENNHIQSKMLLQIHDELVFDVVDGEKEKVADIVKTIMESVVDFSVPMKVSMDFGTDLYETK